MKQFWEDQTWSIKKSDEAQGKFTVDADDAHLAVLMDIRRELKLLNETIKATRFLAYHAPEDDK